MVLWWWRGLPGHGLREMSTDIGGQHVHWNALFVVLGWMGSSSELPPWFRVHGWANGYSCRYWAGSRRFQIVDDHRRTYSLSHWPLAGLWSKLRFRFFTHLLFFLKAVTPSFLPGKKDSFQAEDDLEENYAHASKYRLLRPFEINKLLYQRKVISIPSL